MCLYLWTTTDAFGRLTKKPQNTLVVGNQNAQLDCSTDVASGAGGNTIEWTYDHDYIVWPPCTSQHPESIIASSPNPATDCNIQALSSAPDGISGTYVCIDKDEKAIAMVIVIGSILRLVIFSNYFLHHQCTVIAEFVVKSLATTTVCVIVYDLQTNSQIFLQGLIEFKYGGRLFLQHENDYISAVD